MLMSLFVVPIAVIGLDLMPAGSNPDLFVLTVPLAEGQIGLATLSYLGGFFFCNLDGHCRGPLLWLLWFLITFVMPVWLSVHGNGASRIG